MKIFLLFTATTLVLTVKAAPLDILTLHPDGSNTNVARPTTAPNPEQHISLNRYTEMMQQLSGAKDTIWIVLRKHVRKSCYNIAS